ncbi:SusE domain-containing protein [Flavobacterium sp. AC]|uniref:SusE domain-containing protein n=1 Tax=Flavobacterium azizsancarii TaxID=2961580 RepID=A0ABT4WI27_9FLAO|nr:SusE domain-containing protein [Flavobacterium azizsancarii]MDA6072201.1 SusE domain-containing protein [Flavobacterium azizsancarii]
MKKYINKLFLLGSVLFLSASCDSEAELTTLKSVSFPSAIEVSSSTLVLTEDSADDNVLLVSWPKVTFPIDAPVTYAVEFDLIGDTSGTTAWQKAKRIVVGEDVLSKAFIGLDLNKIAVDLGLPPDVAGKLVVRVEAAMDRKIYSDPITLTVTPYEKSVVFGEIYMPGAYQGEWNVDTALALTAISKGIYQGYVTVLPGYGPVFKLNTGRNWEQFYGAGATNNDLKDMSTTDFALPGEGSYQIKVNLNTLKWSSTPYAWGIVGSSTHAPTPEDKDYGWNHSIPMSYNHETKTWKATANLLAGALKFRLNDKWDVNYGPADPTTNTINKDNGGAYDIGEPGTYEITFTINDVDPVSAGYPATATCTIVKK